MTPQEKWKNDHRARWAFLSYQGGLRRAVLVSGAIEDSEFTSPETKRLAAQANALLCELTNSFANDIVRLKGPAK